MNEDARAKLLGELGPLAEAMPEASEDYLHQLWTDWNQAQVYRRAGLAVGEEDLDPSALEALAANRQLVKLLDGRRWYVVAEARAQGATWQQIADALGVTRQSAHAAYRDAVERMKRHGLPVSSEQLEAAADDEEKRPASAGGRGSGNRRGARWARPTGLSAWEEAMRQGEEPPPDKPTARRGDPSLARLAGKGTGG